MGTEMETEMGTEMETEKEYLYKLRLSFSFRTAPPPALPACSAVAQDSQDSDRVSQLLCARQCKVAKSL